MNEALVAPDIARLAELLARARIRRLLAEAAVENESKEEKNDVRRVE